MTAKKEGAAAHPWILKLSPFAWNARFSTPSTLGLPRNLSRASPGPRRSGDCSPPCSKPMRKNDMGYAQNCAGPNRCGSPARATNDGAKRNPAGLVIAMAGPPRRVLRLNGRTRERTIRHLVSARRKSRPEARGRPERRRERAQSRRPSLLGDGIGACRFGRALSGTNRDARS